MDLLSLQWVNFWETREDIIKHPPHKLPQGSPFSANEFPAMEAQIIELADEIAYNNHDLDDGINSGMLDIDEIRQLDIWKMAEKISPENSPSHTGLMTSGIIRSMINLLVTDLINTTQNNIKRLTIKNYEDVRKATEKTVDFSSKIKIANQELKTFLKDKLYQHYRVIRMSIKAQKVIRDLFTLYIEHPNALPDDYFKRSKTDGLYLTISDYIAGMTDRFALEEHQKLTEPMIRV